MSAQYQQLLNRFNVTTLKQHTAKMPNIRPRRFDGWPRRAVQWQEFATSNFGLMDRGVLGLGLLSCVVSTARYENSPIAHSV